MRCSLVVASIACCFFVEGGAEKERAGVYSIEQGRIVATMGKSDTGGTKSIAASPIDDPVLQLNSQIFDGNVLNPSPYVSEWVVLYCLSWLESECAESVRAFQRHAGTFQNTYNDGLLKSKVRFAQVDCATERPLCNRMGVHGYPRVERYVAGKETIWWNGKITADGGSKFQAWVQQNLDVKPLDSQSMPFLNLWITAHEALTGGYVDRSNLWQMAKVEGRAIAGAFFFVFITGFLLYFTSLMKAQAHATCGGVYSDSTIKSQSPDTLMPSAAFVDVHGLVLEPTSSIMTPPAAHDQSMLL